MMITPTCRKDFEKHLSLLSESVRSGRFVIPSFPMVINGLLSVRFCPNNRMNFLTINETTRLLANTLNSFDSEKPNYQQDAEQ